MSFLINSPTEAQKKTVRRQFQHIHLGKWPHAQEVWQEDSVRRQYSKSLICKSRDDSETMLWTSTSTWVGDRALG